MNLWWNFLLCSLPGEDLHLNLYWTSVTPSTETDVLILFLLSFLKFPFLLVGQYWLYSIWDCILWWEQMVWREQVFCMHPSLKIVHWLLSPTLVVQECPPLVVMSPLHFVLALSVPPLEVRQVCSGGLETRLKFVLELPTVFPQFMRMVPQDLDVVIPMLSLKQPERCDQQKTWMTFLCDTGITLLYHQLFQILLP